MVTFGTRPVDFAATFYGNAATPSAGLPNLADELADDAAIPQER